MDAMDNRALLSKNWLLFRGNCSSCLLGVLCWSHLVNGWILRDAVIIESKIIVKKYNLTDEVYKPTAWWKNKTKDLTENKTWQIQSTALISLVGFCKVIACSGANPKEYMLSQIKDRVRITEEYLVHDLRGLYNLPKTNKFEYWPI